MNIKLSYYLVGKTDKSERDTVSRSNTGKHWNKEINASDVEFCDLKETEVIKGSVFLGWGKKQAEEEKIDRHISVENWNITLKIDKPSLTRIEFLYCRLYPLTSKGPN